MQFTSNVGMNLLITLLVVILITCACGRSCRRDDGGCSSGIGASGNSRSYVRGCGVIFIVLGMASFYSFGYYGFGIAATFLVIGMCLAVAGSIGGGEGGSQTFAPTRTRTSTSSTSVGQPERDDVLFRAAKHAQERGFLEQQPDPYDSTLMIPVYRCPSCGKITNFRNVNIQGNGIVCSYCRGRVDF